MRFRKDARIVVRALERYYRESQARSRPVIDQRPPRRRPRCSALSRAPAPCAPSGDARTLDRAFQQEASYLFHDKEQPGYDFIHRTVECTKEGLGLRFFAVLAASGERGLARYVDRQFRLAREAFSLLKELPDFELAAEPESNILCFRLRGEDELELKVRARLLAEGSFYISATTHAERRWLRLVLMNPDTELDDIRRLAERLRTLASELRQTR